MFGHLISHELSVTTLNLVPCISFVASYTQEKGSSVNYSWPTHYKRYLWITPRLPLLLKFFFKFIYLAAPGLSCGMIFVEASGIFSCAMETLSYNTWNLVPWPGIEPGPAALRELNLGHWTTREVPPLSSEL